MAKFVRFGSRSIVNLDQVCGVSYSKSEGVSCVSVTLATGAMGHHEGLHGHGACRHEFHGQEAEAVWKYFNNAATEEAFKDSHASALQPIPLEVLDVTAGEEE